MARKGRAYRRAQREIANVREDIDQEAFVLMRNRFKRYGLSGLVEQIKAMLIEGISPQEIEIRLQDTREWKQRFKGNEIRRRNGVPVLSVEEYLATEKAYANVMQQYGLPDGFYNKPDDFAEFIGKSVSPAEVEQRVSAWDEVKRRDAADEKDVRQALYARGVTEGHLLAWAIDPKRALRDIQQALQSSLIETAGERTGLNVQQSYADRLAARGVTEEQAAATYAQIGEALPTFESLGDIYGDKSFGQSELEQEMFEGDSEAAERRKQLASQERAAFGGSTRGVLGSSSTGDF